MIKLREDEEELVMEWLNMQTLYSDSIRYLIQKEIAENGLRNLQLYVPQTRTIDTLKAQLAQPLGTHVPVSQPVPDLLTKIEALPSHDITTLRAGTEGSSPEGEYLEKIQEPKELNIESLPSSQTELLQSSAAHGSNPVKNESLQLEERKNTGTEGTQKRKAKKQFGSDVTNSFAN